MPVKLANVRIATNSDFDCGRQMAAYKKGGGMFKITGGRGFHITFRNGVTISVQIGGGSYSDNHDEFELIGHEAERKMLSSSTAEIWAWGPDGKALQGMENPLGWQTSEAFLELAQKVSEHIVGSRFEGVGTDVAS